MKTVGALREEASSLSEKGDYNSALELWREIVVRDRDWLNLCSMGWAASRSGALDEAATAFRDAAALAPDETPPQIGIGSVAIKQGRFEEAEKCLARVARLGDPVALCLLGIAQHSMAKYSEAEVALRRAVELDPTYDEAYHNLGMVLSTSRPQEAEEMFRTALRIDPDYAPAHRELGFLLDRRDEPTAGQYLKRAVELDTSHPWAHVYLGAHIERAGQIDRAMEEYRAAARLAPDMAIPVFLLGRLNESLGNLELAREQIQRAAELEPFDPQFAEYLVKFDKRHRRRKSRKRRPA